MIGATSIVAASVVALLLRVVAGVALAAVVTSLSLRLLGVRRGWGSALLAGVIGWGLAVVVALGVNDWDWGADGLVFHLLAIGIPTTMAVAVTLDLLARPGSLALGERAGLVVTPRPLRGDPPARRRAAPLPRAGAPRPPRGVRPVHVGHRSGPAIGGEHRDPAAPGAGGGGRRLHQARPDRRHTRRPAPGRGVRAARRVAEPGRAGVAGGRRGGARSPSSGRPSTRSSPSSSGNRWRRRRSARPTRPACGRASRWW